MQSYKYRKYKHMRISNITLDSYTKLFSAHCKAKDNTEEFPLTMQYWVGQSVPFVFKQK